MSKLTTFSTGVIVRNSSLRILVALVLVLFLNLGAVESRARTLTVGGQNADYSSVAGAAAAAVDGDTVEVRFGTYVDDFATFAQNRLTLRSVGGRPHLRATRPATNGKGIWVIRGDEVTVDGFEFSGARATDRNGAGIRAEGGRLTVRNSYFHHNQMALLAGTPHTQITITGSEFADQSRAGRFTHSVYVAGRSLHMHGNTLRAVSGGHHVKSRAALTELRDNLIDDGEGGTASYLIDLPDCGDAHIIGNRLRKGPLAHHVAGIAYGAEGCRHGSGVVVIRDNDYRDALGRGPFVHNHSAQPVTIENNRIEGTWRIVKGPAHLAGNRRVPLAPAAAVEEDPGDGAQ